LFPVRKDAVRTIKDPVSIGVSEAVVKLGLANIELKVVLPAGTILIVPLISQSPAVKDIEVMFVGVADVKLTPDIAPEVIYCPMPPVKALSFVVVPGYCIFPVVDTVIVELPLVAPLNCKDPPVPPFEPTLKSVATVNPAPVTKVPPVADTANVPEPLVEPKRVKEPPVPPLDPKLRTPGVIVTVPAVFDVDIKDEPLIDPFNSKVPLTPPIVPETI
jgi:hypothetical protein